jgi:hypothetical protein
MLRKKAGAKLVIVSIMIVIASFAESDLSS